MCELTKYEKMFIKMLTNRIGKRLTNSVIWGNVYKGDFRYVELFISTPELGKEVFYIYREMILQCTVSQILEQLVKLYLERNTIVIPKNGTNKDILKEIWHDDVLISNISYCYGEEWLNRPYIKKD